jgi:chromosomal replication initiator protein
VRENFPNKKVVYTTSENFISQYVTIMAASSKNKVSLDFDKMRRYYRSADVLLVDDIQFFKGHGKASTEHFFHTFNYLAEHNKQVVLAADRSPGELDLDERLISRFRSGLLVDIIPPSYEMKYAILKNFTEAMHIPFKEDEREEILSYIAEKSSSNIREIEGTVTRIAAYIGLIKRSEADLELVKSSAYFPEKATPLISIPSIQKEVCKYYGLSHANLIGNKRKQDIVYPRHVAMYLSQELTDSSLSQIGQAFGKRDHTTVMHAVSKIKQMMSKQPEVLSQIEYLFKLLRTKTS